MNSSSNVMELFSLKGKVALVTGGSGLYGKQIVEALAEAGATVYTASRSLSSNAAYAETLVAKGLDVRAKTVDLSDEESVKALADVLIDECGHIDILVNNAVLRTMKDGWSDTAENFTKSMIVNATGLFIITRAIGDRMAELGGGSIINIGSYMGTLGPDDEMYKGTGISGNVPDYFFHKGGMVNFTKFTASLYGERQVRCNVLNLGGFYSGQDDSFVANYNKRTFLKRMANATDIKGAVVYLASDASAYVTGASLAVDGGYSAK